jgi:alkyl sulfatase BDS1-like metallo-beta-lactamase superfamily hydrolase
MILLFSILILLGITIIAIPKKKLKDGHIANAIGAGLIVGAIALLAPPIIEDQIEKIKQQGVEEYFNKTYDPTIKEEFTWEERFF